MAPTQIVTRSRYTLFLEGGAVMYLQLTQEEAEALAKAWSICEDPDSIIMFEDYKLQGVRLRSILGITKES